MYNESRMPLIGEKAPAFEAETTQGPIKFPDDYKGKWVVFFPHPADFTPVCTTEFMTFATMAEEFKALNCELLGLSIDSTYSHIAWLRTVKEKNLPRAALDAFGLASGARECHPACIGNIRAVREQTEGGPIHAGTMDGRRGLGGRGGVSAGRVRADGAPPAARPG